MTRLVIGAAGLVLTCIVVPASAQLLGSGQLNGGIGGGLGGTPLRTIVSTTRTTGRTANDGNLRVDRSVDRRKGRVRAGGSADGRSATTLDGVAATGGSGSASGSADAQLVGTDAVRSRADPVVGAGRGIVRQGRDGARGGSVGASGAVTGATRNATLALAGSAAANGAGSFGVSPGMRVVDARGRAIGTVRALRSTADGVVQDVEVRIGDRSETLPAASLSGSGDVLVSAMRKDAVRN